MLHLRPGLIVALFSGRGAIDRFRPEAGGHRWQRVPPTERRGRVHSSTVTVAVLAAPSGSAVQLRPQDLAFETYKDSGPGGQHRNTTESAVRVTHLPTGISASSATKSQHRNKELSLVHLRARLAEVAREGERSSRNGQRRAQIGTGQRSDKIRTVAVQRGRVEDHRTGKQVPLERWERGHVEDIQ